MEGKHEMRDKHEGAHALSVENQLGLKQSLPHARFGWLLLGVVLSVPCRVNLERKVVARIWWGLRAADSPILTSKCLKLCFLSILRFALDFY